MTISIREYREADREQVNMIWADAFRDGELFSPPIKDPSPADRIFPGDGEAFVAELDGRIGGAFAIRSTSVTCREALLSCGGIAAVAAAAESRKRGVGKAMMVWAVELMHQRGQIVGNLRASHEIFYRQFGWECAGRELRITCPVALFPALESESMLPVHRLRVEDWSQLQAAYEKFAYAYSGMAMRKSLRWSRLRMASGGPPRVLAAGDPVEAYAVLRPAPLWGEQEIVEFVWSTPEGYESLLSALPGVGMNHTSMSWSEPSSSPLLSKWFTRGVEVGLRHPSMFRVLDVPGSLAALSAASSGTFTLAIEDGILPANRGPWRVSYAPEGVHVERSDAGELQMDIRQYAQALMGEPSL